MQGKRVGRYDIGQLVRRLVNRGLLVDIVDQHNDHVRMQRFEFFLYGIPDFVDLGQVHLKGDAQHPLTGILFFERGAAGLPDQYHHSNEQQGHCDKRSV